MTCPGLELANAQKTLAAAKVDLATKRTAVQKALNATGATDADLTAQCTDIQKQADAAATPLVGRARSTRPSRAASYLTATTTVTSDQAAVAWSEEWKKRRRQRE